MLLPFLRFPCFEPVCSGFPFVRDREELISSLFVFFSLGLVVFMSYLSFYLFHTTPSPPPPPPPPPPLPPSSTGQGHLPYAEASGHVHTDGCYVVPLWCALFLLSNLISRPHTNLSPFVFGLVIYLYPLFLSYLLIYFVVSAV